MLAYGVNHKTAPLEMREKLAVSRQQLSAVLHSMVTDFAQQEMALVSTCNRTELYSSTLPPQDITHWFADRYQLDPYELASCSYHYQNDEAVTHIMRVASGLDSMVIGEPQILGQVKDAYNAAKKIGSVGKVLQRLFETTFSVAKRVRSDTGIGDSPISLAYIAVKLATRIFADLQNNTVLLIGAGETVELCARHLKERGIKRLLFANRTHSRAEELATKCAGEAVKLMNLHETLPTADIVMCATGSQLPLLGKGVVESALKIRRRKPIFLVDLGVPRDIEPEVAELEDIYLYTVDDLQGIADENTTMRVQAAGHAENIIQLQAAQFMSWLRAQETIDCLCEYRARAEQLRDKAVAQALRAIENGQEGKEVVQRLGNLLTNQLIHDPTVHLKSLAEQGQLDKLAQMLELLGLKR